jgi:ABC-type multidrug transport system ATPase subunit
MSAPAIHVAGLWKRYGKTEAVQGIDLDVQRGEIFGLIGPDGAGKTSTFQILGGVMEATSGAAWIYDKPARDARAQTGYLTQSFSLYPDLTVAENIRYIGDLRRVSRADIRDRGGRYLQMFDMDRSPAPSSPSPTSSSSTSPPPASTPSPAANSGTPSPTSPPTASPSSSPPPTSTKPSAATA